MTVIEKLDGLRKGHGLISLAAREVLRKIDDFHGNGMCSHECSPSDGSNLRILPENGEFAGLSPDDKIVKSAIMQQQKAGETSVVLISKDTAVRIKAEAYGIDAEDYRNDHTELFTRYGRVLDSDDYTNGIESIRYQLSGDRIFRLWGQDAQMPIKRQRALSGVTPRNIEQECAMMPSLRMRSALSLSLDRQVQGKPFLPLLQVFICMKRAGMNRLWSQDRPCLWGTIWDIFPVKQRTNYSRG